MLAGFSVIKVRSVRKQSQLSFPQICMSETPIFLTEGYFWKVERWSGGGERTLAKSASKFRSPHSDFSNFFYYNPQCETHFTSQSITFMH